MIDDHGLFHLVWASVTVWQLLWTDQYLICLGTWYGVTYYVCLTYVPFVFAGAWTLVGVTSFAGLTLFKLYMCVTWCDLLSAYYHICSDSEHIVVTLVLRCIVMTSCTSACVNMPCLTAWVVVTDMFPLYASPFHGHGCVYLAFPRFRSAIMIDSALWLFIYL